MKRAKRTPNPRAHAMAVLHKALRPAVESLLELAKSPDQKIATAATDTLIGLCLDARQMELSRRLAEMRRELNELKRHIGK